MTVRIPVQPGVTSQRMRVVLEGREYQLRLLWNQRGQRWSLDVATADGTALASGVPIAVNRSLLLRWQWDTRLPPGALLAVDQRARPADPLLDEIGEAVPLVYVTAAEARAALEAAS